MEEFLKQYSFYLNEGVIVLAAIVGLFSLKKYRKSHVKYFIYFLIYVVFVELLGFYPIFSLNFESFKWIGDFTKGTIFEKNFLWYALFWQLGSAIFLSFYFGKILVNSTYRKIIKYSLAVYLLYSVIYSIINYEVYYDDFIISIWILGVCQINLCIILYFLEILSGDKIMYFYKSVEFYIAGVFFVWLLIKTPLIFYQIYYSKADWSFIFLRRNINLFSNMFMYLTFAFALIYCKPKNDIHTIKK